MLILFNVTSANPLLTLRENEKAPLKVGVCVRDRCVEVKTSIDPLPLLRYSPSNSPLLGELNKLEQLACSPEGAKR